MFIDAGIFTAKMNTKTMSTDNDIYKAYILEITTTDTTTRIVCRKCDYW